jgi:transcriptional regulator with XRE-family HTH domain
MTPATFRRKVAARIQRARWRLGLSQEVAAERVGLAPRYYADLERGNRNPTIETIFSVAHAFKVSVGDLVDVDGGPRVDLESLDLSPPKVGRPKKSRRRH